MKRITVALVALLSIGTINSYAAFPTFVWTEEYRSELYAVEMAKETGVEDLIVFDVIEDEPATPTDIEEPASDEGMNATADEEEDSDSDAQSIASYDIEPAEEQQEDKEEQPTLDDTKTNTDEEPDTPVEEQQEDQEG